MAGKATHKHLSAAAVALSTFTFGAAALAYTTKSRADVNGAAANAGLGGRAEALGDVLVREDDEAVAFGPAGGLVAHNTSSFNFTMHRESGSERIVVNLRTSGPAAFSAPRATTIGVNKLYIAARSGRTPRSSPRAASRRRRCSCGGPARFGGRLQLSLCSLRRHLRPPSLLSDGRLELVP